VENRVYDEETPVVKDDKPATQQEIDSVVRPKYIEAIGFALKTLEKATLRDEDEDAGEKKSPEGEPVANTDKTESKNENAEKDPWSRRKLPLIIGTKEYNADDYAGLLEEESEDEEDVDLSNDEGENTLTITTTTTTATTVTAVSTSSTTSAAPVPSPIPTSSSTQAIPPVPVVSDEPDIFSTKDSFFGENADDLSSSEEEKPLTKKKMTRKRPRRLLKILKMIYLRKNKKKK